MPVEAEAGPLRQRGESDDQIGQIELAFFLRAQPVVLLHEDAEDAQRQPGEDDDRGVVAHAKAPFHRSRTRKVRMLNQYMRGSIT